MSKEKRKRGKKGMKEKIWKGKRKYVIITSLDGVIQNRNVNYVDIVVADKYINNDSDHYYIVVSSNGDVFDIVNITDSEGIFKQIQVGKEYRFVTKQPFSTDDKYIHILQVYDGTNQL